MSSQGPSSTSTTSLPDWATGALQGYLGAGAQAAQTPYRPYTGQRVADLSPLQQQALGGYGQLAQNTSPLYGTANQTLQGMISGNMNPYTQDVVNRTTRSVTDAYNQAVGQTSGRFNSAGNWGSARQGMRDELNQRALATGLTDGIGTLNSNAFNTMQANQLQGIGTLNSSLGAQTGALNSALNAGSVPQQNLQSVYNTAYNDFVDQRNYPWQQLQNFGGLLASAQGSAPRTTTSSQGYDPVSQGLGAAALGSSMKGGANGSSSTKGGSTT